MRSGVWTTVMAAGAMLAAGCTTLEPRAPEITPPPGHQKVVPSAYAMVGRLYREGTGERPWLLTGDGDVYSEICWNDFVETAALREIDKDHVVPAGNVIHPSASTNLSINASLSGSGLVSGVPVQVAASAAPNATFELSDLRLVVLTDTGEEMIKTHLGPNCRQLVREHRAAGRKVVLLAEGLRADSGRQTGGLKVGFSPQAGPVAIGMVTDASSEIKTSNMLVSARMKDL